MSFRGAYLLLNMIDTLSSDRHDNEYKKLLSDVKCRTVNKQYAQWLLSIRSFALINLCWAVIKFYRKTVRAKKEYEAATARILTARSTSRKNDDMNLKGHNSNSETTNRVLEELDGRLSSLTLSNYQDENSSSRSSSSSASSISSESSNESSSNHSSAKTSSATSSLKLKLSKTKANKSNNKDTADFNNRLSVMTPANAKYELYLEAVYK